MNILRSEYMNDTIMINIYGGPGCGKSTTAAGVFALLKIHKIECELVTEFAKDLTWENRQKTLENQLYILAKQYHKVWRLPNDLEVIVTDSPIIFSGLYSDDPIIKDLSLHYFNKQTNMNFFLDRVKEYNPIGRNQTEEEAKELDRKNLKLLQDENLDYTIVPGNYEGINIITNTILNMFNIVSMVSLIRG
jgi:ABC-type oligopeptide transport system ATPase subunit